MNCPNEISESQSSERMLSAAQRKGIMGGTFDPIHNGHLTMAECAYRQLELDTVLFLPAGNPPHKQRRQDGASDQERLDMVRLAIRDLSWCSLDSEEMCREGLSYTKDTLVRLKKQEPETDFYFLIGADSLMAFEGWYHPELICANCTLAVAGRDDLDFTVLRQKAKDLQELFGASIVFLDLPQMPISSTRLRRCCENHQSIQGLVPDAVWEYIVKNKLYGR